MPMCRCGDSWTGSLTAHCTTCHDTFTGEGAFVAHGVNLAGCKPETRKDGTVPTFIQASAKHPKTGEVSLRTTALGKPVLRVDGDADD